MFLLLAACLGQSFLTSLAPALLPPARGTTTTQTAATAPAQAAPKKHLAAKAAKAVPAIKLSPCDKMGDYDIPAQRFDETMQQITHATGCGIFDGHTNQAESDLLSAVMVSPVRGHLSVRAAMLMALKGTRWVVVRQDADALYVRLSGKRPAKQ